MPQSDVAHAKSKHTKATKRRARTKASKASPAPPTPRPQNHLADVVAQVLWVVDDFDSALCQAALDVSRLGYLETGPDAPRTFEERMKKLDALQFKIERQLLACFSEVSSLRAMANLYEGIAGEAAKAGAA